MFGDWITDQEKIIELAEKYHTADPYPHVVIDHAFRHEVVQDVFIEFPIYSDPSRWVIYDNPIEHKKACNKFNDCERISQVFKSLQSEEFISTLVKITGIENLENDPHLHGAGLHFHENGGHLNMHLDYDIHPISGKQRRVNVILFLNPEWNAEEYHGELELWDAEFTHAVQKIAPVWNRMVIFRTDDISWHGLPTPLDLPPHIDGRRSLAIYYVSDPVEREGPRRHKAQFRARPNDPVNPQLEKLYEIRAKRTITPQDLEEVYPQWRHDQGRDF